MRGAYGAAVFPNDLLERRQWLPRSRLPRSDPSAHLRGDQLIRLLRILFVRLRLGVGRVVHAAGVRQLFAYDRGGAFVRAGALRGKTGVLLRLVR